MENDICKCEGTKCPLKNACWRYKAPTDEMQTIFVGIPYDHDKKSCEYYWKD